MDPQAWAALELHVEAHLAPETAAKILRQLRFLHETFGFDATRDDRDAWLRLMGERRRAGAGADALRNDRKALGHALAWRGETWPKTPVPKRPPRRARVPYDDVVARLCNYGKDGNPLDELARAHYLIGHYSGVRAPSELIGLNLRDFDGRTLRVRGAKNTGIRYLRLERWLADAITQWITGPRQDVAWTQTHALLPSHTGRPWRSRAACAAWIGRRARKIWAPWSCYAMRRWCATRRHRDWDLPYVSQWLGHESYETTRTYLEAAERLEWSRAVEISPARADDQDTTRAARALAHAAPRV